MSTVLPSIIPPMRLPSISELTNSNGTINSISRAEDSTKSSSPKLNLPTIGSNSSELSSSSSSSFKYPPIVKSASTTSSIPTSSANYVTTKPSPSLPSLQSEKTPVSNQQPTLPNISISASTSPVSNYQYQPQPQPQPHQHTTNIHSPIITTQVHSHPPPPPPQYIQQYYAQPIYYHPHHMLPPGTIITHHPHHPHAIPHYQIPMPEIINKPSNKCHRCGTTETPEWRRGPKGVRTLCNACGLYHAKLVKRKGAALAAEEVLNNKVTKGKNGRRISLKKHLLNESLKTHQIQDFQIAPPPSAQVQIHHHHHQQQAPSNPTASNQLPPISNKSISLPPPINQHHQYQQQPSTATTAYIPQLPLVRQ